MKTLRFVGLILIVLMGCVELCWSQAPTSEYTPGANTFGLWHFNEGSGNTAFDASASGNDGTITGASWTTNGQFGNALDFDGADDGVVIDNPFSGIQNNFTIEAWINIQGFHVPGQGGMRIFQKRAHFNDVAIHIDPNPHTLVVDIYEATGAQHQYIGTTDLEADGEWDHIAITYDKSHFRIWLNGNLELEVAATYDVDWSKNYIGTAIGDNPFDSNNQFSFNGIIDEVRISDIAREFGTLGVSCDIKPGSDPNSINPKSKGVIPVAILTTPDFDASTVDPTSVMFGPGEAGEAHGKGHLEDVDGDGNLDMVLHFRTQDSGIQAGDIEVTLSGATLNGKEFTCTDAIVTVGGGKSKNKPNPFNPTTTIQYSLEQQVPVTLTIYNVQGQILAQLVNTVQSAGNYSVRWNASHYGSGIYFYRLEAGQFAETRKILLLK